MRDTAYTRQVPRSTSSRKAWQWWISLVLLIVSGVLLARILRELWAPALPIPETQLELNLA